MSTALNHYSKRDELILVYSGNFEKDSSLFPFVANNYYLYFCETPIANSFFVYYPKTNRKYLYYPPIDTKWSDDYTRLNIIDSTITQKPINMLLRDLYSYRPKRILTNNIITTSKLYSKLMNEFNIDIGILEDRINISRGIKNDLEIEKMRNASKINSILFRYILEKAKSYKNEREIVNDIDCKLKSIDSDATVAYLPICSNGKDNAILHYTYNKKPIKLGNLVLLDSGCRIQGYCSDVTRTFPISGKFTKEQRDIYQIVLKCYKNAIELLQEGSSYYSIEDSIRILMYNELVALDLVYPKKTKDEQLAITQIFMPHSLGHSIGLEVHDKPEDLNKLLSGMLVTVEPGIYFNEALITSSTSIKRKNLQQYISIGGIRIEDVLLITRDGSENLVDIPVEIDDIESLIN